MFRTNSFLLLLILTLLAACKEPVKEPVNGGDSTRGSIDTTGASAIDEKSVIKILADGSKLFWGVMKMRTSESMSIGGERMRRIDPTKIPTMKALRERFHGLFTEQGTDSVIACLGIVDQGGKVWVPDGDDEDIAIYDDAEVNESKVDKGSAHVTIEVPLGDTGQTDLMMLHLVSINGAWRIDNAPYCSSDEAEEGSDEEE